VVIKGLALAQADIGRGVLTSDGRDKMLGTVSDLIENLSDFSEAVPTLSEDVENFVSTELQDKAVLLIAGREPLDQAAAILLSDLLRRRAIKARIISTDEVSQANIHKIDPSDVGAICLSYLESENPTNARFLVRRLRKQFPDVAIVAGFWRMVQDDTLFLDWLKAIGSDYVVSELAKAVDNIAALASTNERIAS